MADALERLKERMTDVVDLSGVVRLLSWDQQTMMPAAGVHHRADQMALLQRLLHERIADPEVGRLLDELAPREGSLDPDSDDAALIRLVRRDHEKAVQVPSSLRSEMARAGAEARPVWVKAKAESNFASFLPALERIVELKLRYVDCFEPRGEPYDLLLDDYERDTSTAEVLATFAELTGAHGPCSLMAALRSGFMGMYCAVSTRPQMASSGRMTVQPVAFSKQLRYPALDRKSVV